MMGDEERNRNYVGPLNKRSWCTAIALHLAAFLFFWIMGKVLTPNLDMIIPMDMTIVPPWAQQTDDPEPDPNPPPPEEKPQPKPLPKPPPEPEPKVEQPKVEAVEQVKEKPKPKKKEPVDLRKNAKLVKAPPKPVEPPPSLKDKATLMKPPPQIKTYGKGTAADKPLSPEEFMRKMNEGYRIGAHNQIANDEVTRCISVIAQAIRREWNKESFKWYAGLRPLQVVLQLGPGGRVRGFQITNGSGDADVDRTAQSALRRLTSIPGLSATFLDQFPQLGIVMEPTQGH